MGCGIDHLDASGLEVVKQGLSFPAAEGFAIEADHHRPLGVGCTAGLDGGVHRLRPATAHLTRIVSDKGKGMIGEHVAEKGTAFGGHMIGTRGIMPSTEGHQHRNVWRYRLSDFTPEFLIEHIEEHVRPHLRRARMAPRVCGRADFEEGCRCLLPWTVMGDLQTHFKFRNTHVIGVAAKRPPDACKAR